MPGPCKRQIHIRLVGYLLSQVLHLNLAIAEEVLYVPVGISLMPIMRYSWTTVCPYYKLLSLIMRIQCVANTYQPQDFFDAEFLRANPLTVECNAVFFGFARHRLAHGAVP